jgi:hypothetical protein
MARRLSGDTIRASKHLHAGFEKARAMGMGFELSKIEAEMRRI